jgi:hypothetical protein
MKGLSKILILVPPIIFFVLLGSLVYASAGTPILLKLLDDFNVSLQFLAHRNALSLCT